jgi:TolB-like protein
MAALYVVAAWLVMQVAEVIIGLANLPERIGPIILALLAVGFPIALVVSWFFEWTPEGISVDKGVDADESMRHLPAQRINIVVVALLCAGLVLFAYDKWWIGPPPERSIAVLPFADLSPANDQAFFSDGVAEEILNLLGKMPDLRVISRSSSFQFRGDVHLPDVAERLNVLYVLEGSVRKTGDRIRVTAQLIDARSNTHVWSENFDRVLTDVFAIQEDIAASIAEELQVHLAGAAPRANPTDQETYALYLQANHLLKTGSPDSDKAETLLRLALERDPDYVPALNLMVNAVFELTGGDDHSKYAPVEGIRLMRSYNDRVLAIEPDNSRAIADRGWMAFFYGGDLETAVIFIERALSLEPENSWTLFVASVISRRLGRNSDAIEFAEAALMSDPLRTGALYTIILAATRSGQFEKALAASERHALIAPGGWFSRGDIYLLQGNVREALRMYENQKSSRVHWLGRSAIAYHELGDLGRYNSALEELKMIDERSAQVRVAEVYAWLDNRDEAFEWLSHAIDLDDPAFTAQFESTLWSPFLEKLRDDARWLELRRQANMAPERLDKLRIEMPEFE